jgi:hypothetical protein
VSRGGGDVIENLVCASYFYNRKKLNNGSDKQYLFHAGKPTDVYFWNHGELSAEQALILKRHACLEEADWYFNRAIFNIRVALGDEYAGVDVKRKRDYWLGAADKQLVAWRKIKGLTTADDFLRRGLVRYSASPDVEVLLELAGATEGQIRRIYDRLFVYYRANANALDAFSRARDSAARRRCVEKAEAARNVTPPLLDVLRCNAERM